MCFANIFLYERDEIFYFYFDEVQANDVGGC